MKRKMQAALVEQYTLLGRPTSPPRIARRLDQRGGSLGTGVRSGSARPLPREATRVACRSTDSIERSANGR